MGDELSQKFAQISELLNQEGMADNIKGIIGMLSNSTDSQSSSNNEQVGNKEEKSRNDQNSREFEQNLEMMRQVQRVMEVMRSTNDDPRMNLLNAIRPYLNNSRQIKVNNAMRMLQMSSITKLIDKDGKSLFKL